MNFIKIFFVLMTLNPWFSVFSYESKVTLHNVCIYKNVSYRTVRVQQTPGDCDVIYTKLGRDKRIALRTTPKSCQNVFENIVSNLKIGNWTCKNIFGSGFTIESNKG